MRLVQSGVAVTVYDPNNQKLFLGEDHLSPAELSRYHFDLEAFSLDQEESLTDAGTTPNGLTISPDGTQLAFPCGAGNGGGDYTIYDWNAGDFSDIRGEWYTDAYPSGAAFSPNGKYLLATDGGSLIVFDATTHVKVWTHGVDLCGYGDITQVGFSRGGRIVYGYSDCGFEDTAGELYWAFFDP